MKKLLLLILISFNIFYGFAQTPDSTNKTDTPIKTIFNNTGKLGWWVAPEFAWTQFDERDAYLLGISGGIIVKHSFSIGFAGYGIINSGYLEFSGINDTANVYLYGGYGGLKMEYRIMPLNVVNVAFPLLIGGGGAAYSSWGGDDWHNNNHNHYPEVYIWETFFLIEPGVMVGLNLLDFMRLDMGASYRFTSNIHLPRTDSDLMTNMNLNLSLKFGRF